MTSTTILPIANKPEETLGTPLPAIGVSTITQGGPPNFADTYVTPFTVEGNRNVFSWKAQFGGGRMINGGCGIAVGIQLKVLRPMPGSTLLQVIAAGVVHHPLADLQARFGGDCPSFLMGSDQAVLEFPESGLAFSPGDIVGLTIMSDPSSQGYFYPLMPAPADTRLVLRNAAVGQSIDLADIYTGKLVAQSPAVLLSLGIEVAIAIHPGKEKDAVDLHSQGVLPVAILSSPSFDATTVDPATLSLAGAPVETAGKSGQLLCHRQDVDHDGRTDLVCDFRTTQISLPSGSAVAVLEGQTLSGVPIRGQESIRVA
jgi:hypothetical protein